MIKSWWDAHVLEVVVTVALIAVITTFVFFGTIAEAWREHRRKKRDGIL
ncbi:MAG: hypothetical protein ACREJC_06960 [Tepidisphaeraceae bacterium]